MDQILAQETGKYTQLASLELAIETGETAGACDTGYACPYTNTISWKSANTPLVTQNNPRVVFERLFGDTGNTDPKARLTRIQQQRSVLDSLKKEVAQLQGSLGPGDSTTLTLRVNANANTLQPGTWLETVLLTNTTSPAATCWHLRSRAA